MQWLHGLFPHVLRLLRIVWPFLAVVVLLVLLGSTSIAILSSVRAYVGGEGLWSKAQKEAVYYLNRYADTRSEADYRQYLEAIAVPLGDRKAREELEKPRPDLAVARQGFIEGRNHPDDISGMIWLFRRFRNVSFIDQAIAIWADGDRQIGELMAVADALHTEVTGGKGDPRHEALLSRINDINTRLTPLEYSFSATLGEASRYTAIALLAATLPCGQRARRARHRDVAAHAAPERGLRVGDPLQRGEPSSRRRRQRGWPLGLEHQDRRDLRFPEGEGSRGLRRSRGREFTRGAARAGASRRPRRNARRRPIARARRGSLRRRVPVPHQVRRLPLASRARPLGAGCRRTRRAPRGVGRQHRRSPPHSRPAVRRHRAATDAGGFRGRCRHHDRRRRARRLHQPGRGSVDRLDLGRRAWRAGRGGLPHARRGHARQRFRSRRLRAPRRGRCQGDVRRVFSRCATGPRSRSTRRRFRSAIGTDRSPAACWCCATCATNATTRPACPTRRATTH